MTRLNFKLNRLGVAELAKGAEMRRVMHETAQAVAGNVDSQGLQAQSADDNGDTAIRGTVFDEITDRARSSVTIEHPAALAMEAKHGVLTKAVGQAGLEVHGG